MAASDADAQLAEGVVQSARAREVHLAPGLVVRVIGPPRKPKAGLRVAATPVLGALWIVEGTGLRRPVHVGR